jgi:hypothetical protein
MGDMLTPPLPPPQQLGHGDLAYRGLKSESNMKANSSDWVGFMYFPYPDPGHISETWTLVLKKTGIPQGKVKLSLFRISLI